MFPDVDDDSLTRLVGNCKDNDICALTEGRILIWSGDNLENLRGGVVPEPAPAAPVNPNSRSVELFLEPINRVKVAHKCVLKLSILEFPTAFFESWRVWLMWPVAMMKRRHDIESDWGLTSTVKHEHRFAVQSGHASRAP